jgi:phosphoenolpyruvate carboxylase
MAREWPFFQTLSQHGHGAGEERYRDRITPRIWWKTELREAILARARQWDSSREAPLSILDQRTLLERNPTLAHHPRRFPYIDPLNHVQLDCSSAIAPAIDERVVKASISPSTGLLPG